MTNNRPLFPWRWLPGLLLLLVACNVTSPVVPTGVPTATAIPTLKPTIEATMTPELAPLAYDAQRVEDLLRSMTLREKVGQMFLLGYFDASPTLSIYQMVEQGKPGGVVLFAHNVGDPQQTAVVVNDLQAESTVPLLIAADQEGGIVTRLRDGFTLWPNMLAVGAARDEELAARVGAAMGDEMAAVGVNMALAPVADPLVNIHNGVIGVRSFGSVPELVGRYAGAIMDGFHAGGVIATAKHFPGHGGTLEDSHLQLPTDTRAYEDLTHDLAGFQALIDGGVDVMMTAHVVYPALSEDGLAATFSPAIVTRLLRDELGFEGVVLTDALSMGAVLQDFSLDEAVRRAIIAGVDMVTFGRGVTPEQQLAALAHIVAQVETGVIAEERVDESVRRILGLKERYSILDAVALDPAAVTFDLAAHQNLSYEVAAFALTETRDRERLLPLDLAERVTVVYPLDASGTARAFTAYDPDANLIGISRNVTQADWNGVLAAAEAGGPVVVLTLDAVTNDSLAALVRALPPERTIAVALRSPYDILVYPDVSTYLLTYGANDYALDVLARRLYGRGGAPGRLPVDMP